MSIYRTVPGKERGGCQVDTARLGTIIARIIARIIAININDSYNDSY